MSKIQLYIDAPGTTVQNYDVATIEDVRVWAEENGCVLINRDVLFPDVPTARRPDAMEALLGHMNEGAEALNHNMAPDAP